VIFAIFARELGTDRIFTEMDETEFVSASRCTGH